MLTFGFYSAIFESLNKNIAHFKDYIMQDRSDAISPGF